MRYVKGKGYLVGIFNETDMLCGRDKLEVSKAKLELGLNYTNTGVVTKNGIVTGIRLYVCGMEDVKLQYSNEIGQKNGKKNKA